MEGIHRTERVDSWFGGVLQVISGPSKSSV